MAIGPFVQQITSVESAQISAGTTSLYARTEYPNLEWSKAAPLNPLAYYNIPDLVTASIYQGIYSSNNMSSPQIKSILQLRPDCPTGNCTFDDYDSLAVCSACADITGYLRKSNTSQGLESWSLPDNFNATSDVYGPIVTTTTGSSDPLVLHAGLPIVNITAIQPCFGEDSLCTVKAQECMLHWCVNKYRSWVSQGVYYDEVLDTIKYGYTTNANLLENDTYVFRTNYTSLQALSQDDGTLANANLTVSKWGSAALTDLIADLLTFTVNSDLGSDQDYINGANNPEYTAFPGIPLDMTPFFESMASSMSTAILSDRFYAVGLQTVNGQTTKEVPFIRVQWAWIGFPFALQLAVLFLLLHTVWSTSQREIPIWRASALATILSGSRVGGNLELRQSDRLTDLKKVADRVKLNGQQIYSADK